METRYRLIDGYERHNRDPDTFDFPGFDAVSRLRPGDFVKIGVEFPADPDTGHDGERFWVRIASAFEPETATCFIGNIDNDLHCSGLHGLRHGDEIGFEPNNVLAIAKDSSS